MTGPQPSAIFAEDGLAAEQARASGSRAVEYFRNDIPDVAALARSSIRQAIESRRIDRHF